MQSEIGYIQVSKNLHIYIYKHTYIHTHTHTHTYTYIIPSLVYSRSSYKPKQPGVRWGKLLFKYSNDTVSFRLVITRDGGGKNEWTVLGLFFWVFK